jgi:hypothetical protein
MIDQDALAFFNGLSGRLKIELTEPAQQAAPHLLNLVAPKGARIVRVDFELEVFEDDDARPLTEEEWSRVVVRAPRIKMVNLDTPETVVETPAPHGGVFTVRDLQHAVARSEHVSREGGDWMGGVDVHHVYFEGIEPEDGGVWAIAWGS